MAESLPMFIKMVVFMALLTGKKGSRKDGPLAAWAGGISSLVLLWGSRVTQEARVN